MESAPQAKLTSRGRITIPKAVRKRLKLKPGTRVEVILQDRYVVLRRTRRK